MKNETISLNKNRIKELMDKNLMVVATLFFSGAFIAGKFSIAEFPVYSLTFFRFLIAAVILFLIMWKRRENFILEKTDIPRIILLSLLGMVGYHVLFFTALKIYKQCQHLSYSSHEPNYNYHHGIHDFKGKIS